MPKLNSVIASILDSLDSAQHKSNLTTSKLAEQYKTDNTLKYLQLPNAVMSEVDITLRYAINTYSTPVMLKKSLTETSESAEVKEATFTPKVLNRSANRTIAENVYAKLEPNLSKSAKEILADSSKKEILIGRIQDTLYTSGKNQKSADDTTTAVLKTINESLSENGETITADKKALSNLIANGRQKVYTISSSDEIGDLDVIIDANALAEMPADAIQTLHITTKMKNYRWIEGDSGEFVPVD
jgi:hypothetical protein